MLKEYSSLISELREKLVNCSTSHDLANIKSYYLGKNGIVSNEFLKLNTVSPEERKILGSNLNNFKQEVHNLIIRKNTELSETIKETKQVDISLPGSNISIGSRHPVNLTINRVIDILGCFGFDTVDGYEIEDEFHNFDALNIQNSCLLYTSPSPRDLSTSRMPSSA